MAGALLAEEPGTWRWSVDFDAGEDIAVGDAPGRPLPGDGADGTFEIAPPDPLAPGFASIGRLRRADARHLHDADGNPWIRGGIVGPGSLLGYAGFDGTVDGPGGAPTPGLVDGLHRYGSHVADWREGDPDFRSENTGVDSRGLVGAINYLADQGVNSIRFPVMNLGGDGRDTHPFVGASGSAFDDTHYDVSKLFQWHLVLEHMNARGIAAHVVLSEREHDNVNWLDGGGLGVERRLHHRELVARFGHLNALTWHIGGAGRYGPDRESAFARHLQGLDGARHPVSAQVEATDAGNPEASHAPPVGRPELDPDLGAVRRETLYLILFGGGGLEWRLGEHDAPLGAGSMAGDFRAHAPLYRWTRVARELATTYLPLDRAVPDDGALVGGDGGDRVFSVPGEVHALYLPDGLAPRTLRTGRTPGIAVPVAGDAPSSSTDAAATAWEIAWFDPRAGRFEGERRIAAGPDLALGAPPFASGEDWVVLVRRAGDVPVAEPDTGTQVVPVAAAPPPTPANPLATLVPGAPDIGAATASPVVPAPVAAPPSSRRPSAVMVAAAARAARRCCYS